MEAGEPVFGFVLKIGVRRFAEVEQAFGAEGKVGGAQGEEGDSCQEEAHSMY